MNYLTDLQKGQRVEISNDLNQEPLPGSIIIRSGNGRSLAVQFDNPCGIRLPNGGYIVSEFWPLMIIGDDGNIVAEALLSGDNWTIKEGKPIPPPSRYHPFP